MGHRIKTYCELAARYKQNLLDHRQSNGKDEQDPRGSSSHVIINIVN